MEHLALRGCFQHRGIFTKVYVRFVWIRNFKILNRDQYGRIFFYYAIFFFLFPSKYINYCNKYIKKYINSFYASSHYFAF